jgi:RNA polymerase sigma-70 factor (ECF subfamily)
LRVQRDPIPAAFIYAAGHRSVRKFPMNDSNDPELRRRSKHALERSIRNYDSDTADITPNPAEIARIEDAVRRLSRFQREIFLAIRLDDYTYADIAERTGLTVQQVERLFAKALGNFCRNLDDPRRHWWRRWLG